MTQAINPPMSKESLINLIQRISRSGLNRVPKKQQEAKALLALSLSTLDSDGIYDEEEIDDHINPWLNSMRGPGSGVDHATWRRALVDFWFLRRATDGAIYRIRDEAITEALEPDARTVNPTAIFMATETTKSARQATFSHKNA